MADPIKTMKAGNLEEIRVESFWGAIASFFLLQCFGFVVFQGFLFHFMNPFGVIWGGLWIALFIFFQSDTIQKIKQYFFEGKFNNILPHIRQPDDLLKMLLSFAFAGIFAAFLLGHYPFPKTEYDFFWEAGFFAFSILASSRIKKAKGSSVATGGARTVGFLVGLLFFGFGIFEPQVFYFHGMVGLGISTMMLCAWLLSDQIK